LLVQPVPQSLLLPDAEIQFYPALFSATDCDRLWTELKTQIQWRQDRIQMFGRNLLLPRLTAWYGDPGTIYSYSGIQMTPLPWIDCLLEIKSRLAAVSPDCFNSVLLNFYRDGQDSMGWHSDDEPELGTNPVIASVSFGGSRKFKLRHKHQDCKTQLELTDGSLLFMRGKTQHFWHHQVPKAAKAMPRINLTFRWIQG
jgi:alkylated DNA repair dioxygenase AlkB